MVCRSISSTILYCGLGKNNSFRGDAVPPLPSGSEGVGGGGDGIDVSIPKLRAVTWRLSESGWAGSQPLRLPAPPETQAHAARLTTRTSRHPQGNSSGRTD